MSASYYLAAMVDNCVPWRQQLHRDQTLPLSVKGVACETRRTSCVVVLRLTHYYAKLEQKISPYIFLLTAHTVYLAQI